MRFSRGMPSEPPISADLASALAARVLHDLSGQVSGLVAAFDLLADPGSAALRDEAMALAESSARGLARQIALQRLMLVGGDPFSEAALAGAAREVFGDGRGSLELAPLPPAPPLLASRVFLALIEIARGSNPGGRVLAALSSSGAESLVRVSAQGSRARLREEERRGLDGEGPVSGPFHRWALASWVRRLVIQSGGGIAIGGAEGAFEIEARIRETA